jgi:hypothetical protein
MQRVIIKLVVWLLESNKLSFESRNKLITCILNKLYALPFRDIIKRDEQGVLLVNGKPLDLEGSIVLKDSARGALQSVALKLIREQVAFNAVTLGVHQVQTPDQMIFSRAAIWWGQNEESLLKLLASEDGTTPFVD